MIFKARAEKALYYQEMKLLLSLLLVLSFSSFAQAKKHRAPAAKKSTGLKADAAWAERELQRIGFSKAFIAESLKYYEPQGFEKTLTLNLLTFLRPAGQHMDLVTPQSVNESMKFIKENQKTFHLAETTYQVPPHVIAALLWIETRHGEDVGTYHTVSVYLHLLQANLAKNRKILIKLALEKNRDENNYTPKALRKTMAERIKKKSQWAQEQLIALAGVRKLKHLDLKTLRGSYAGAFGLPQFIPSSYQAYAKSVDPQATPDLTDSADAILSVAYYLSIHGWKNEDDDAKVEALMKYNNSRDYADSILEISKRVTVASVGAKKRNVVSSAKDVEAD
jgi:membrane-bound lytic murein transglycosylase B